MKILLLLLTLLCGRPAAAADTGQRVYRLKTGGYERVYRVYAPAGLEAGRKYPLLLLLHGGGGNGKGMVRLAKGGFEALADRHGAVLAYPDGVDGNWNDYRGDKSRKAQRENIDDAAFLGLMAGEIAKKYPVDLARVYAAGISNGAMMSYALACRAADRFAAIAPVAGAMPANLAADCKPARPVPVLIISGTEDRLVHWEGGHVSGPWGRKKLGVTVSVERSRDFWLAANGCDAAKKRASRKDADPEDGTALERESYADCAAGSAVEFVKIAGGGHTWPGGLQYLPAAVIGRTSRELDATEEIWEFFMRHPGR